MLPLLCWLWFGSILDIFFVSSNNESCNSSRVLIAGVEINTISSVGVVAGVTGYSSALISFLFASHLWSLNDFDLRWFWIEWLWIELVPQAVSLKLSTITLLSWFGDVVCLNCGWNCPRVFCTAWFFQRLCFLKQRVSSTRVFYNLWSSCF